MLFFYLIYLRTLYHNLRVVSNNLLFDFIIINLFFVIALFPTFIMLLYFSFQK